MFFRILRMTKFLLKYPWQFAFLLSAGVLYGVVEGGVAGMTGFFVKLFSDEIPMENAGAAMLGKYAEYPYISDLLHAYGSYLTKTNLFYCGVLVFVLLICLLSVMVYFQSYIGEWLSNRVSIDTRQFMVEKLLHLDFSFFKRMKLGDILARITSDLTQLNQAVFLLTVILTRPLTVTVCLGYAFYINWKLALWALIGMPAAMLALRKLYHKMRATSMMTQLLNVNVSDSMIQFISGIATVKAFGCEDFELRNFSVHNANLFKAMTKRSRATCAERPITSLCSKAGVLIVIIISGQMIIHNELAPGDLMAFLVALSFTFGPGKELSRANASLQTFIPSAERVFEVLDTKVEVNDGTYTLEQFTQKIEFSHVDFSYEQDKQIIHDFSLSIPKGRNIALVGVSGSGKTTLINLLLRLYDIDCGEIKIDGKNIRELTFKSLRSQMALVSQNPFLFNCSVRDNITYGRNDVSQEEIENAAKAANIHNEIMNLPQGYDTLIGDRGETLSGGQRQRLSIARALCKNAPILLLDEATSALDSENEAQVQSAIENLMRDRTTITIAHRLSTIKNADEIVMLQEGRIIGRGNHKDLVASCPEYAHLVKLQGL